MPGDVEIEEMLGVSMGGRTLKITIAKEKERGFRNGTVQGRIQTRRRRRGVTGLRPNEIWIIEDESLS